MPEKGIFTRAWARFWMYFAGPGFWGRISTRFATWLTPPHFGRAYLARLYSKGYTAPSAAIHHEDLRLGSHVCISDRVTIYQTRDGGPVQLGDRVIIHSDTLMQTGQGGTITIGAETHIHPRCLLSGYKSPIRIGSKVLIAANCAFYSYNHGIAPGAPVQKQPLQTRGGIVIEDEAWLGFGVIVLDGVRIGKGAVIGAGSVVTHDVPESAIAVGNPARVIKLRSDVADRAPREEKQDSTPNGLKQ